MNEMKVQIDQIQLAKTIKESLFKDSTILTTKRNRKMVAKYLLEYN